MSRVLLVDDEEALRVSLAFTLRKEGYEVACAADGPTALEMFRQDPPDIVLLDLMLPGVDGMEICRQIRATSDVPVIMLTAKDHEMDRISGLERGADDYVTKPFSTRELVARMKAVMRRREAAARLLGDASELRERYAQALGETVDATSDLGRVILNGGDVTMDLDRHEVTVRGEVVEFAPKEFQLLRTLLAHRGKVISRNQLITSVWGGEFMGDLKTLDVHIRWLREKIERDPSEPRHILTVRGVGYRYE